MNRNACKFRWLFVNLAWSLYGVTLYQLFAFIGGRIGFDYRVFADIIYYGVFALITITTLLTEIDFSHVRIKKHIIVILCIFIFYYFYTWYKFPENFQLTRVVESYSFSKIVFFFIVSMLLATKIEDVRGFLLYIKRVNVAMSILTICFIVKMLRESDASEQMTLAYALALSCCLSLYYVKIGINKRTNIVISSLSLIILLISGCRGAFIVSVFYFFIAIIDKHFFDSSITLRKRIVFVLLMIAIIVCIYFLYIPVLTLIGSLIGDKGSYLKIINAIKNGEMFLDSGGRAYLQGLLFDSYKGMPFMGYGFAGDVRALNGLYYAHNLELEFISHFGFLFGTILYVVLWKHTFMLLFGKRKRTDLLPIAIYVMLYLQFSTSYLLLVHFWIYLGLLFGNNYSSILQSNNREGALVK